MDTVPLHQIIWYINSTKCFNNCNNSFRTVETYKNLHNFTGVSTGLNLPPMVLLAKHLGRGKALSHCGLSNHSPLPSRYAACIASRTEMTLTTYHIPNSIIPNHPFTFLPSANWKGMKRKCWYEFLFFWGWSSRTTTVSSVRNWVTITPSSALKQSCWYVELCLMCKFLHQ